MNRKKNIIPAAGIGSIPIFIALPIVEGKKMKKKCCKKYKKSKRCSSCPKS